MADWAIEADIEGHPPGQLLGRYYFDHSGGHELSGYETAVFSTRRKARRAGKIVTPPHRVVKVRVTIEVVS